MQHIIPYTVIIMHHCSLLMLLLFIVGIIIINDVLMPLQPHYYCSAYDTTASCSSSSSVCVSSNRVCMCIHQSTLEITELYVRHNRASWHQFVHDSPPHVATTPESCFWNLNIVTGDDETTQPIQINSNDIKARTSFHCNNAEQMLPQCMYRITNHETISGQIYETDNMICA